ncbi:MAG TPA: porin [Alphaproteobacteria bacterium]|nr:porin [Alphaproteobacteria bacterium]
MFKRALLCGCAVGTAALLSASAHAQTPSGISAQMNSLQQQIQQLQQQLQSLQTQVKQAQDQAQQAQTQAQQSQQATKKVADDQAAMPKATFSASGRPGFVSADGRNSIELTSRLQFDMADYLNTKRPDTAGLTNGLDSGVNARRARIGVLGKFMEDWRYGLIFDGGGSSDSLPPTTGAPSSIINNAFITYNGFNHGDYPVAIDLGYIDVPWTLDEATSSNDIMFLERASSQTVATEFGGGDARSAFGFRSNDSRYWAGVYGTGPTAGATHASSAHEQFAFLGRVAYQVLQDPDYSLHVGVNGLDMFHPPSNGTNSQTFTLSDRPELRVDPTNFLNTGAMVANSGYVVGGEVAGAYENAFFQGEYFHYGVDQYATPGSTVSTPRLNFDGGYAEASYSFGGRRKYLPATGAYSGVIPDHPLAMSLDGFSGGWGALEVAARYSYVNLNDHVTAGTSQTTTGGVFGGNQHTWSAGANWYVNNNVRFMLDYLHAKVDKLATNGTTQGGVKIDALALRSQVAF